jgi:hypothetical protein
MTLIRATCTDCGDVDLGVADVRVRVCRADGSSSYLFRCPTCQMTVSKRSESRVADLLAASGVEVVHWDLPSELFEPRAGAPITHDDLIDFHLLLQDDGWQRQLSPNVDP